MGQWRKMLRKTRKCEEKHEKIQNYEKNMENSQTGNKNMENSRTKTKKHGEYEEKRVEKDEKTKRR